MTPGCGKMKVTSGLNKGSFNVVWAKMPDENTEWKVRTWK